MIQVEAPLFKPVLLVVRDDQSECGDEFEKRCKKGAAGLRRREGNGSPDGPGGRTNVAPRIAAAGETVGAR